MGRRKKPPEIDDVKAISLLSVTLRADLMGELCRQHLHTQQLFRLVEQAAAPVMRQICHKSISFKSFLPQDIIFMQDTCCSNAYFITSGSLEYAKRPQMQAVCRTSGIDSVEGAESQKVCEKSWLAWAAMWSEWTHVGTAEATASSEVLILDVSSLLLCIARSGDIRDLLEGYSLAFPTRLISAVPPAADFPDDLHVPFTDYGEIVMAMGSREQKLIGTMALERLEASKWPWQGISLQKLDALQKEVFSGRCVLIENAEGAAERVVPITAMRLERDNGDVLVVMAKQQEGCEILTEGKLPGTKQNAGEEPVQAVRRILREQLQPFSGAKIYKSDREDVVETSHKFRIRTKYIRVIFHAALPSGCNPTLTKLHGCRHHVEVLPVKSKPRGSLPLYEESFVLMEGNNRLFCAWVSPETVDFFRKPDGQKQVRQWTEHLSLDDERHLT